MIELSSDMKGDFNISKKNPNILEIMWYFLKI